MTPFKNQEKIIKLIVSELQGVVYPKSWNIVIPPCFYAGPFSFLLSDRLKRDLPNSRVALIAADSVYSPKDLVHEIHFQWTGAMHKDSEEDAPPNVLFAKLLNTVGDGRNILIINEFHKILGRMDERILVALRSAEQSGRINTITIAIYPHKWLREKWKKEGHLLNVSNYGDHSQIDVEVYNYKDVTEILSDINAPNKLSSMVFEWTGGIPKCLDKTLEAWINAERPEINRETTALLKSVADESLERFVKFIDPEGSNRFSQLITDIHYHINEEECYEKISRFHPWAHIILDEDGLRIDALGDAITKVHLEEAFNKGTITENLSDVANLAIRYYNLRKYDLAIQVLQRYRTSYNNARLELIELHSRIMEGLRGGISGGLCPNGDTEWKDVIQFISKARGVLLKVINKEGELTKQLILNRYNEIENLALYSNKSRKINKRYLDVIGGLFGNEPNREAAFTLAVFQLESARFIPGNTIACKTVIELPEQSIRLWGLWKHGVNYYSFPVNYSKVWGKLLEIWPARLTTPELPPKGDKFSSLYLFCYYLYVLEHIENIEVPTWQTQNKFDQELAILEVRNDITHATVHINSKTRKKLFELIDIWLDRLERDCMGAINRNFVMSKVEPLEIF